MFPLPLKGLVVSTDKGEKAGRLKGTVTANTCILHPVNKQDE
jgi:hypothetical protein